MRSGRAAALSGALWGIGCTLALPIHPAGLTGDGDAGGADASADGRAQDDTTLFCGPSLECPHADPRIGCCVLRGDGGSAPSNYSYQCTTPTDCYLAGGSPYLVVCDERADCPGTACCFLADDDPRYTKCAPAQPANCPTELCNPADPTPCAVYPGYRCVPSGAGAPAGEITPLGYHVCVP